MIILSKDKTKFGEYNRITVQHNFAGGKDKKFSLVGYVNSQADILDYYPTKEAAVAQLEKLFYAYQNRDKTYIL